MSSIVIAGDTSGTCTLQANAIAGTTTLTLPTTSGYLFSSPSAGTLTVPSGGTGVTTLTGLAYGNGTSAFTAASAANVVAVIGSTAVANATYATTAGTATSATSATSATTATTATNVAGSGITGSRNIPKAAMPAGTVLQVISTTTTAPFSTSSSSFVAVTGLSATITPTSSTSKIVISGSISYSGGGGENATIQLQRNGTVIFAGDPQTGRKQGFSMYNGAYYAVSNACQYLDSPGTTSAVTYQIYMAQNGGQTGYVNQTAANRNPYESTTASTITVMEIAV